MVPARGATNTKRSARPKGEGRERKTDRERGFILERILAKERKSYLLA